MRPVSVICLNYCPTSQLTIYLAEVMPHVRSEVISSKYVVQYIFAAAASAAVEPVIGAIGVGWTFTICEISRWGHDQDISDHLSRCILCSNKWVPCACYHEMGHWYAAMVWKEVRPRCEDLTTTIWLLSFPLVFMSLHPGDMKCLIIVQRSEAIIELVIDRDRQTWLDDFQILLQYKGLPIISLISKNAIIRIPQPGLRWTSIAIYTE